MRTKSPRELITIESSIQTTPEFGSRSPLMGRKLCGAVQMVLAPRKVAPTFRLLLGTQLDGQRQAPLQEVLGYSVKQLPTKVMGHAGEDNAGTK